MPKQGTFKAQLITLDSSVWGLGFMIPPEIVDIFRPFQTKRFIHTINGIKDIHRTMMPLGDDTFFLYVSKGLMKELKVREGEISTISVREDDSKYGMAMPEELSETLEAYPEAHVYFHALTPGKQRNLIHMVGSLKRIESKVKKAVHIAEYLETYNGKLDFKALNAWFKMQNAR